MARIVVTGRIPPSARDLLEGAHPGEVWMFDGDTPAADALAAQLADAEALVAVWYPVGASLLDAAPNLKVVANTAVGYDNIDVVEGARRGITVTNTPGVLTEATADVAFGLLLAVTRRLAEGDRLIRRGQFPLGFSQMLGVGLQGRQLGVVGMGAIGQAVARRGRAFGHQGELVAGTPLLPLSAPLTSPHRPFPSPHAGRGFSQGGLVPAEPDQLAPQSGWLV